MRINIYDTEIDDDYRTILVKEKGVNYGEENFHNPEAIALMLNEIFHADRKAEESCYLLCMNNKNRMIGVFPPAKGVVNQCQVGMRELFMRALLAGASNIIISHNHPSKDATPSTSDILLTKRVKETCELMGIPLLDHIIIGGESYYSFANHEIL